VDRAIITSSFMTPSMPKNPLMFFGEVEEGSGPFDPQDLPYVSPLELTSFQNKRGVRHIGVGKKAEAKHRLTARL
jgi:hypothetical protein